MLVFFTPKARAQLRDIHDYIARENPAAARAVVMRVEAIAGFLGDNPEAGYRLPVVACGASLFGRFLISFISRSRDKRCASSAFVMLRSSVARFTKRLPRFSVDAIAHFLTAAVVPLTILSLTDRISW